MNDKKERIPSIYLIFQTYLKREEQSTKQEMKKITARPQESLNQWFMFTC
ncbi:unnamed protein product [Paramecium sonneborni]|uniref:Uncharacterized protein n=1 Tax=Paramecium sonneborni TaxID=65129 RepID=A0A8S1NFJ6_9CILI|nr:unnamed protein product [Paramecium sonneborni]